MMLLSEVLACVDRVYGSGETVPRPFLRLRAVERLRRGAPLGEALAGHRFSLPLLRQVANSEEPVATALGITGEIPADRTQRTRAALGQLLLGQVAERSFETLYKTLVGTTELRLQDVRESRNDTDYRVFNGHGRAVFRLNIKFFGTPFQRAQELVGLDPADCFALATYKIHQALLKQEREQLPYIFVVVGVQGLTGVIAGEALPQDLVDLSALAHAARSFPSKRDVEDAVVKFALDRSGDPRPAEYSRRVQAATWSVISARKAANLLREKLFERVYALRVRGFTRSYRNAEVDMHFSISDDLMRLTTFLAELRDRGPQWAATALERGAI
jgi:hypothetical protein